MESTSPEGLVARFSGQRPRRKSAPTVPALATTPRSPLQSTSQVDALSLGRTATRRPSLAQSNKPNLKKIDKTLSPNLRAAKLAKAQKALAAKQYGNTVHQLNKADAPSSVMNQYSVRDPSTPPRVDRLSDHPPSPPSTRRCTG
jgi:hypothetical protein